MMPDIRPQNRKRMRLVGRQLLAAHPEWMRAVFNYGTRTWYNKKTGERKGRALKEGIAIVEAQAVIGEGNVQVVTDFMWALKVEGYCVVRYDRDLTRFVLRFDRLLRAFDSDVNTPKRSAGGV